MRNCMAISLTIWIFLSLSSPGKAWQEASSATLVYSQKSQETDWMIGWQSVPEAELSGQVAIPSPPVAFAAPAIGHYFSVVDSTSKSVYVINALDNSLRKLEIPILQKEGFAFDDDYRRARSMRWSPDGSALAFVGQTSTDRADVYIYDTTSDVLANLTADIPFTSDLLNLSSWSPDGQWMAVTGRWQQDSAAAWMTGGILSADGETFVPLDLNEPVCRLIWSSSQEYLVSPTDCPSYPGSRRGTDLVIFHVVNTGPETQVLAPSHISDHTENSWNYYHPTWRDDRTIVAVRSLRQPVVNGTPAPVFEFIEYNVSSQQVKVIPTEIPLRLLTGGLQDGNQIIWQDILGNSEAIHRTDLVTGSTLSLSLDYPGICSVIHARFSSNDMYLAFVVGCQEEATLPRVVLWDVQEDSLLFEIGHPNLATSTLGWINVSGKST